MRGRWLLAAGLLLAPAAAGGAPARETSVPEEAGAEAEPTLLEELELLLEWELLRSWDPGENLPIPVDEPAPEEDSP